VSVCSLRNQRERGGFSPRKITIADSISHENLLTLNIVSIISATSRPLSRERSMMPFRRTTEVAVKVDPAHLKEFSSCDDSFRICSKPSQRTGQIKFNAGRWFYTGADERGAFANRLASCSSTALIQSDDRARSRGHRLSRFESAQVCARSAFRVRPEIICACMRACRYVLQNPLHAMQ
jgi:hypothetical protein